MKKIKKLKGGLDAKRVKKKVAGSAGPLILCPVFPDIRIKNNFSPPTPPPKSLTNTPIKQKVSIQDILLIQPSPFKNTSVYAPRTTPTSTLTATSSLSPTPFHHHKKSTKRNRSSDAPVVSEKRKKIKTTIFLWGRRLSRIPGSD